MIWLFTIPALRARKGMKAGEKAALNVAFLIIPLLNVGIPFVTKDFGVIWAVDVVALGMCYGWCVGIKGGGKETLRESPKIKGLLKCLDWGSWR